MLPFRSFLKSYDQALDSERFVISRHDVEFDPNRALELAKIENDAGLKSTYFFQSCSDAYNITSVSNRKILAEIETLGHEVGLHLYVSHLKSYDELTFNKEVSLQTASLNQILPNGIKTFSVHRPKSWFLEIRKDVICSLLNAYGPSFFEYGENPKEIKYFADSMHRWNYGVPEYHENFKKYQILTHPDEWFESPNTQHQNYHLTYRAHCENFNKTMQAENKVFETYEKIR